MIRHIGRFVALAALCAHAGSAMALVDAQVLVGRRWYDYKPDGGTSKGVASQEVQVAVHVDPIPLVPIAFGLSATAGSPNKNDLGVNQAALAQVSAEVMGWIPMVPLITPYVRVRYPLQSSWTTKQTATDSLTGLSAEYAKTYKVAGPQVTVGAKIPTLPLIKLLVEVGQANETYKSDEIKVAGLKADLEEKGSMPSKSFLFGIEVGL